MIKWRALVGWGIVIYAVVFLVWSMLVIHGFILGLAPDLVLAVTLIAVAALATRSLHLYRWYDVLPYSLGWVAIAMFLDLLCAVPVSGFGIWSDWHIWVGYALLALTPLFVPTHRYKVTSSRRF